MQSLFYFCYFIGSFRSGVLSEVLIGFKAEQLLLMVFQFDQRYFCYLNKDKNENYRMQLIEKYVMRLSFIFKFKLKFI